MLRRDIHQTLGEGKENMSFKHLKKIKEHKVCLEGKGNRSPKSFKHF